ncbi:MAG: hypothetical protein AAF443_06995 [Chlamydiota bacterium]
MSVTSINHPPSNPRVHENSQQAAKPSYFSTIGRVAKFAARVLFEISTLGLVSPLILRITKPSFLDTERPSNYSWVDVEYGRKTALPLTKGYFSGLLNQATILFSPIKKWNQRRLETSIERYRSIGAESILLHTETGDNIHSCYFKAKHFQTSLANIGGEIKQYDVNLKNPLLQSAEPVKITTPYGAIRGIKVPYNKESVRDRANLLKIFTPDNYVMCYIIDEINSEPIKTDVVIIEKKDANDWHRYFKDLDWPFFSKEQITTDDIFNPAFSMCFAEGRTGYVACFNNYNTKDLNQIEAVTVVARDEKSNADIPIGKGFTIPIAVLNNQPTLIKEIESVGYTALNKDTLKPITSNTVSARDNRPSHITFVKNSDAYKNAQNRRLVIKKGNDNKEQTEKTKTALKPLFRIERYPAVSLFNPVEKALRKITAIELKNSSKKPIEATHIPSQVFEKFFSDITSFADCFDYTILDAKTLQSVSVYKKAGGNKTQPCDVILVKKDQLDEKPLEKNCAQKDAITSEAHREFIRSVLCSRTHSIQEKDKTLFFADPICPKTYQLIQNKNSSNARKWRSSMVDILVDSELDDDLKTYVQNLGKKNNYPEKDYRNMTGCLKDNKHAAELGNKNKAVVVISQHQTGTMHSEQCSQEILAFLMRGINVLTYDYAGKGKSQGRSSAASFQETFKIIGQFLIEKQKFKEQSICFKGVCAGGVISLKAAELFKKANIWLDQTSVNFYNIILNQAETSWARAVKPKITWLKRADLWWAKFFVKLFARLFPPPYDATKSLLKNKGKHFYTIGIPNIRGKGGDMTVPKEDQEKMKVMFTKEDNRRNNHYIEIEGEAHNSYWWTCPQVSKSIKENGLWTVETV